MFDAFVYALAIVAVLAFAGERKPVAVTEVPEVLEVSPVTEIPATPRPAPYHTLSIADLKALGKQHNIPGWKAWKKPETAIAKLAAIAA